MKARNQLLQAPLYPVEQALTNLGKNLRTARVRRRLKIDKVTQKIGTGRLAVMDAERENLEPLVAWTAVH
jgi:hypothetical protein